MEAVAINVGANTTLPGLRGPVRKDGSFVYIPIPEREPTRRRVPTYTDLSLPIELPEDILDTPVHLDPSFGSYPCCSTFTYGDEHGVKAGPIGELQTGQYLFFYATLSSAPSSPPEWMPPEWGAYLIGHFRLAEDPITDAHERGLSAAERDTFAENAHVKREHLDARVLVRGDPDASRLYDVAVPLSTPDGGTEPGDLVTEQSTDSGRGPWWRRPLRFPESAPIFERLNERNA